MAMRTLSFKKLLILGFALQAVAGPVDAKKMYRMVDENGNVYFSDQVPPEKAKNKRETLGEDARVLNVLDKAKTPEQLEQQKKLDALRKEQEKIVAKQAANDKVLLSTFRNLEDMNRVLENKQLAFAAQQKVIEGNIQRYEQQLLQQQQQAADHERNGRKVPDKLLSEIASTRQQIDATKQEHGRLAAERQKMENEFKADMARFQFLTQGSGEIKNAEKSSVAGNSLNSLGLFVCLDAAQCEKAWKIAGEFVAKHSTTTLDVQTDKLITRAAPTKDDDLSLSVSKLEADAGQLQIFLDVHCKQSSLGSELCSGPKVRSLREEFAPFISSQLAPQQ